MKMITEQDWNKQFMKGFGKAIELVSYVFSHYKEKTYDNLWSDIEKDVEHYIKNRNKE